MGLYVLLRIMLMVRIEAVCEGTKSLVWRFLSFFHWERIFNRTFLSHVFARWWVFSLTEPTEFTEPFGAQFRAHEEVAPPPTPPPQGGAWYVRLPLQDRH